MERTPTRCGFCGRQGVTRNGRCPECGHVKRAPAPMPEPPAPSIWRELRAQLAAAALAVLLVATALVIGSMLLLYVALLFLAAVLVIAVVASGIY